MSGTIRRRNATAPPGLARTLFEQQPIGLIQRRMDYGICLFADRSLGSLDRDGGLRMTRQERWRTQLVWQLVLVENLIDDIGVGQSDFWVVRTHLLATIPKGADERRGIFSCCHHAGMEIADGPTLI